MNGYPEDEVVWKELLRAALRAIDSLPAAGYGGLDFRLGGGTVLMFAFDHRISRDIDIFFDDAQAISFLSPRLNDTVARIAGEYHEQANSLKLVLAEGDIDFIVASSVTRAKPDRHIAFEGRAVPLDPVAEILAKKILYRAASFKLRDLFDLAVALERDSVSALAALAATASAHDVLWRRLAHLERQVAETGLNDAAADLRATGPVATVAAMAAAVRAAAAGVDGGRPPRAP